MDFDKNTRWLVLITDDFSMFYTLAKVIADHGLPPFSHGPEFFYIGAWKAD
jgi:hypothetical protein